MGRPVRARAREPRRGPDRTRLHRARRERAAPRQRACARPHGAYPSAESAFRRAEDIYRDTGVVEGRAEVLYQRGFMLRTIGKLPEAREQLQQALDLARTTGNETQQISALLQLSTVASNANDASLASRYAREAVELAQANGMENLAALGLVDLGNTFFARGDYAEAEKYLRQGLSFAERNKAPRVLAKARINMGSLRIQQGVTDEGVQYVEQALAFYQPSGYRKESAQALAILGRASRQKGNYAEAQRAFEQQLQLAEQVGDPSQIALIHVEIGNVLLRQDSYAEALKHFDECHRIEKSLGDERRAGYSLLLRADALWPVGRAEDARAALKEAAELARKAGSENKDMLAGIHLTGAEAALSERRFAPAKDEVTKALANIGANDKRRTAKAKLMLALTQARSGEAAERACNDALTAAREVGDPALLSAAQLALAEALLQTDRAPEAAASALAAQEFFARAGQPESEWRAWLAAARASRRAKDEAAARQYAARAAAALEALAQKWGREIFQSYQARPDVQAWRRQLSELSADSRPA
ncbi:MAG: tetratricopeptide repeat protein [Acidobacteria bacterium]|nr:tetratricopeptide repeat protein [Acidobacteriota bacterium]